MPSKIAFVTGSRADYGIVRRYLRLLQRDAAIDLRLIVTGALLAPRYGRQVDLVRQDGFAIAAEIALPLGVRTVRDTIHTMAVALDKAGAWFAAHRYDLVIILGDRYEIFSFAMAAAMHKLPILHIHGGEATYGNYDEFIRHAITKMSWYHFAATAAYARRIIQLGEAPDRVFTLGALGAENCLQSDASQVPEAIRSLRDYFVVLFHPETLSASDPADQIQTLLTALDGFPSHRFVFLGSNADTYSDSIRKRVQDYLLTHDNACYFENLPTEAYHYLVRHSRGLVGNSSSGIIEAPSLGVYTINIGDRQKGRIRGNSVLDVACTVQAIQRGMRQALAASPARALTNPYYQPQTAQRYYEATCAILRRCAEETRTPKAFYDLPEGAR